MWNQRSGIVGFIIEHIQRICIQTKFQRINLLLEFCSQAHLRTLHIGFCYLQLNIREIALISPRQMLSGNGIPYINCTILMEYNFHSIIVIITIISVYILRRLLFLLAGGQQADCTYQTANNKEFFHFGGDFGAAKI